MAGCVDRRRWEEGGVEARAEVPLGVGEVVLFFLYNFWGVCGGLLGLWRLIGLARMYIHALP